jgi:hypothetical protein
MMAVVTVTDLVLNFAAACRALVPSLELAEVPWQDGRQYDNFHRVAEPLFLTLVTEPCAFQAGGETGAGKLQLARYAYGDAEGDTGWIVVSGVGRLISLASVEAPFDYVRCGEGMLSFR